MAYAGRTEVYDENDIRSVIPEANDPTIEIWAPELKNEKSLWLVGTSPISRVKISALASNVEICTADATTITGTTSENLEPVETLGTVVIHICNNFHIEAHVTRSKGVAPLVVDGILGLDVIRIGCWEFDKTAKTLGRRCDPNSYMAALPGGSFIPDYVAKLRESMRKMSVALEKGEWAVVSRRLDEMRPYLPPETSRDDRSPVIDVLDDYADCFYVPGDKIGSTKLLKYPIKSRENDLIYIRQPSYSSKRWDEIEILISDLLRQDIIRESTSPYNFPIGLQEKKPDSRGNIYHRVVVDYNELNNRSEIESFPIPSIIDASDELYGSKYFSVIDLASASYQIALEPQDRRKTAFTTRSGRYEFQRMPVGIKNGSQYTQRLMNKVFEGMRESVFVCHDDVLVHAKTIEEHEVVLRKVLARVRENRLKLQPGKCQLFKNEVIYLGHLVTDKGLLPDPVKIEKLRTQSRPETSDDLRSYLGLSSTFKRFIPDYAARSKLMWDLLKNTEFHWTRDAINSFENFQSSLSEDLILRYPDWSRPFFVETGSSLYGIYAGLMQSTSESSPKRAVAWASRTYTPAETRYEVSEQKCIASVYGLDTFRRYVQNTDSLDEVTKNLSIKD